MTIETQVALKKLIDELLEREEITDRPSEATSWSQVHLVRKTSGGWRFTVDYRVQQSDHKRRAANPQCEDMQRIGSLKPRVFGVVDLT